MLSPERRVQCVAHVQQGYNISQRGLCKGIGQPRSTLRYQPMVKSDEAFLRADIIALASRYGRYGYRRILAMLRTQGWRINHKRVERIWRQEWLRAPKRQPNRGRVWLNDGSCIRLRQTHRNHVWSYDFVSDRSHGGRDSNMLTVSSLTP